MHTSYYFKKDIVSETVRIISQLALYARNF